MASSSSDSSEEETMTSVHIQAYNKQAIIASGIKYERVFVFDNECTDEELDAICRLARVQLYFRFLGIAVHLNMRVVAEAIRGSTLEILGISEALLTDEDVAILAPVLPSMSKLDSLAMPQNRITDVGALDLARVIPQCPRLSRMDLDLNRGITDVGARAIVNALNARHTLAAPYMVFYGLTNVSPETRQTYWWGREIRREIPRVLALYGTGRTPAQTWAEWRDGDHAMMYRVLGFLL